MFCGSASGQMMPPFLVYPEPKRRGYNPLSGSIDGTDLAYTKKGWMDRATFSKFTDHFDRYAGVERPVLLLFDSVSSHVDHDVFMKAKSKGTNATHLMQPLVKVFLDHLGLSGTLPQESTPEKIQVKRLRKSILQ